MTDPTPEQARETLTEIASWSDMDPTWVQEIAAVIGLIEKLDATARANAMNMADYTAMRDQRDHAVAQLREARNEIAWLNGQTFEVVVDLDDVRAEAWDRGKAAGFTQLTAGPGTITPADVANPYRKRGDDD